MERFWDKVSIGDENDCWEWLAYKLPEGYGTFRLNERKVRAHRFSAYLSGKLDSLDSGLVVMHTCDNPSCVNPRHLVPGTQSENMQDCSKKGRLVGGAINCRGFRKHKDKLSQIEKLHSEGLTYPQIAEATGVPRSTVARYLSQK